MSAARSTAQARDTYKLCHRWMRKLLAAGHPVPSTPPRHAGQEWLGAHSVLSQRQPSTWNTSFNEAAQECGLTLSDLLALDGRVTLKGWSWERVGDRIQCARAPAIWTIARVDLRGRKASQ